MGSNNKTYRVHTNVGEDTLLNVSLQQDYDMLELLSLKISTENMYKLHTSNYGCVVGRVLANGGVGVPNAKISIFIKANEETTADNILYYLYPYTDVYTKNSENIRYNLLPDEEVSLCHQQVGTFPNKRLVLDDDNVLEIFDTYYKYTTTTNAAGDYMIFGVPVGEQTIHMDVDLSDIGILSQKPIDLMYKGYNITQFESTSRFKKDTNLNSLSQIISQNKTVDVYPFWGDESEGEVKITRHDIDVDYKFEPTCIFIGSVISEDNSNAFSKKCIPSVKMGRMDKVTTGSGTIEMIRKTPGGDVESYSIQGNELIDGNGTWCYQIPMNLDYVTTDEYGNLVPTDNPEKGIPTRTRVRFRVSLSETEDPYANNHYTKVLIPHNPKGKDDIDYIFGTNTKDVDDGSGSFRDLMWNNVYTVKSYLPRIQKGNYQRTQKFSGIKNVNVNGGNNPIPYNNMRVNITFMFVLQCAIIKTILFFIRIYNTFIGLLPFKSWRDYRACAYIGDGICPDAEGWYFAPGCRRSRQLKKAHERIKSDGIADKYSNDDINSKDDERICVTTSTDYLMQCIEINLAMENEVIQFDFYNDWVNGLVYLPRWFVKNRKKRSFLFGLIKIKPKVMACLEANAGATRRFVQQCSLSYNIGSTGDTLTVEMNSKHGCKYNQTLECHKSAGRDFVDIFGKNGGIVHEELTLVGQSVYYPRPCEWINGNKKCNLYATDIVLLGNINECNEQGIPNMLSEIPSSTFQMPPNLAQSNMDNDGALYGRGGKSICSGVLGDNDGGLESVEQTFDNYVTWSKNKEFYEKNPDDITEYEVTEMSGIDWSLHPPGYGDYTIDTKSRTFSPGGHFLGISCFNAQVNTRSCVNLSRICELGSLMSQRQYRVIKDENNIYDYQYIRPTGLISKNEISDSGYKYVFSTLNHNGLKTKVTEDGLRKYDFISVNPINFDGAAQKIVNDEYNKQAKEGKGATTAITHTIEDMSNDYYSFRMGVTGELDVENVKNKYLYKNGSNYFMPVYENSYYFYFGLKDGNTAIDRFFTDYYSVCFKEGAIENSDIEIEEIVGTKPCEDSGEVKIKIIGVTFPCEIEIYNNDTHGSIDKETGHTEYNYTKSGLPEGSYTIAVRNDLHGQGISKTFDIGVVYSNEESAISEITGSDFEYEPYIHVKKVESSGKTTYTYNVQDGKNGYISYVFGASTDNYIGTIICDSDYYTIIKQQGITINDEIVEEVLGYKLKEIRNEKKSNINSNSIEVWEENNTYRIYSIFKCNDSNKYYGYLHNEVYIGVKNEGSYLYMYDDSLRLSKVKNFITGNTIATQLLINDVNIVTGKVLSLDKMPTTVKTSSDYWKLKKCLIFNNSLFDGDTHNLRLGVGKKSEEFEYIYAAEGEKGDEKSFYLGDYYTNADDAEKKGYTLDWGSVSVPSFPFLRDTVKKEYKDGNFSLNKNGRGYIFFGNGDSGNTVALPTYYRPFHFNTVIMMAPSDTHNVKYSEDGNKNIIFAPKIMGGYTNISNASAKCNILLFSNVYNGISAYGEKGWEIGDIDLNINNGESGITLNLTGNIRNVEETYETGTTPAVVTRKGLIMGKTLKETNFKTGGTGTTYNNSSTIMDLKESFISSYFNVKEGCPSDVLKDDVDEIAETINGVKFFDNIYVDDKKRYHVSGTTGNGVRYYEIQRTGLQELFRKLNGNGILMSEKYIEQKNWRSVLSYVTHGVQLYVDEVTDRLTDAMYYDYTATTGDVNTNLNVKKTNNFNHVIGVYDVYTNLSGSKNSESDYRDEMIDAWSVVPKHTNLLSIVRLYKVETANEDNYVKDNDGFFYKNSTK